jgi:hypothetical protein
MKEQVNVARQWELNTVSTRNPLNIKEKYPVGDIQGRVEINTAPHHYTMYRL